MGNKLSRPERAGVFPLQIQSTKQRDGTYRMQNNAGKTYAELPYEIYAGYRITPANYRDVRSMIKAQLINEYMEDNGILESKEVPTKIIEEAFLKVVVLVRMHQKAFKKYLKGDRKFRYKGKAHMIETVESLDRIKEKLAAYKEKYAFGEEE